jgi:hypothetical protein
MANKTQDLKLVNDSEYRGNRNWGWNVWLEGPAVDEGRVESVTYHLHPTFHNPVHSVTDKTSKFKLSGSGWGEFNIKAEVYLADGEKLTLNHWLKFDTEEKQAALKKTKGDILLSHSTADGPVASQLAALLIAKGYRVTASAMVEFSADANWQDDLGKSIAFADLIVVFISSGISEYIGTLMSRVLSTDESVGKKLLPVLLGSVEIPELVRDIQMLRIGSMNELERVVDAVENLVEGSSA